MTLIAKHNFELKASIHKYVLVVNIAIGVSKQDLKQMLPELRFVITLWQIV